MSGFLNVFNWLRRNPFGLSGRWLARLALLTLALGWSGNMLHAVGALTTVDASTVAKLTLDSLVQTFQLFTLGATVPAGKSNWLLTIARACGAVVAGTTVLTLLAGAFRRDVSAWLIRRMKHHTILCGLGERNKSLAADLARRSPGRAVAIDVDAGRSTSDFCAANGIRLIGGNAREKETLRLTNPTTASHAVIVTGQDERNLSIARTLMDLASHAPDGPPLSVFVAIDDLALADQIATNQAFTRPTSARDIEVTAFSMSKLAARDLLARAPMIDLVHAAGQDRLRVGMVGICDTQVEILLQILRLSPGPGVAAPHFDIFVGDVEDAQSRLAARSRRLIEMLRGEDDARRDWAGTIVLHRLPARAVCPDDDQLDARLSEMTVWIVAHEGQDKTALAAIQLRQDLARRRSRVPIFAHLPLTSSLDAVLESGPDAITPFGRVASVCRLDFFFGDREARARALHAFHQSRNAAATAAAAAWKELPETFRQSNRRAVDHLDVKERLARHLTGEPLLDKALASRPDLLDQFAAMEHNSWRLDRELDGWRHGETRDDVARRHPDLVPFAELSEDVREANRLIVRKLASFQAEQQRTPS